MFKKLLSILRFFGKKIADFQAAVFLSLVFILIVPVFALIAKLSRKEEESIWTPWDIPSDTLDEVRRQY